jgi:hypothetical protein
VLSGRGLCDGLITRPEESYRFGASLCVIKKPRTRGGYSPARGLQNTNPQWVVAPVEKNAQDIAGSEQRPAKDNYPYTPIFR